MTAEQKVKQKYPAAFAHYIICGMANSYWSIMDGENEISRTYCGALHSALAWADAWRRIQAGTKTQEAK